VDGPVGGLRRHEHRASAHRDRRHRPDEGVGRTTAPIPDVAAARSACAHPFGDLPSEAQEPGPPADRQRLGRGSVDSTREPYGIPSLPPFLRFAQEGRFAFE